MWITILAGGIGSRFWPASTPERPKQLLPLGSEQALIHDTVARALLLVPASRLRILAGEHLVAPFRRVLPDLPGDAYMVEPRARGTCPVLAWAAREIVRHDPEAVMVSLHADHLISPPDAFAETVATAVRVAREHDALVTVGAVPDRVETGYGHIQPGDALPGHVDRRVFRVGAFHEKPEEAVAKRYTAEGYLWNTGIFVWKAGVFLDEVRRHAPEVGGLLPLLDEEGAGAFFARVPSAVVDRAVLERSERVACVRASFAWDDVGSWASLHRTGAPDDSGNVVRGEGVVVEGRDNVVWAEDGRVVLWGLDDVVVVRAHGTTLVMPRDRSARLKDLFPALPEAW